MPSLRSWLLERNALEMPPRAPVPIESIHPGLAANVETRPLNDYPGSCGDIGSLRRPPSVSGGVLSSDGVSHTSVAVEMHAKPTVPLSLAVDTNGLASTCALDFQIPRDWSLPGLMIQSPAQIVLPLDELATPGSMSLFVPLRRPSRAGKRYGEQPAQASQPERQPNLEAGRRCIHGMDIRFCAICNRTRQERKPNSAVPLTTVDVFDLLLPLLYPPISAATPMAVVFPPGKVPYPFQYEGIKFLTERTSALLADEMGLGKTIQALVALRILLRAQKAQTALVLCPQSLLGVWERELREWAPELSIQRIRGSAPDRKRLWASRAHVCFTTYETFRNDIAEVPALSTKFDLVILDEAQRIKNPDSQISRACANLRCIYRWGLTGTPLENKVDDIIAIFRILRPGLFPNRPTPSPTQVKERISPYFLRRRAADVLDELPDKVSEDIWLELDDSQRQAYEDAEAAGTAALRGPGVTRIHVFTLINQLKQLCNWDPGTRSSCKLDYLAESLEHVVESSEKALVFSHYPEKTLQQIMPELRQFDPVLFSGSLNDSRREDLIRRFTDEDTPRIMLASVQSGGVGLTLTRANHVFHYDHWWNPAVTNQATGRAHRIGQTRTVFVSHLYVSDTIEERIYSLLKEKRSLFDMVIDDMSQEDFAKRVTDAELFGLFGLPAPGSRSATEIAAQRTRPINSSRARLQAMTPRQFEEAIAKLYEAHGYSVELTSYSRDGGIDLYARRVSPLGSGVCLLVQCKHMPSGTVGAPVVQQLLGAIHANRESTGGAIVTSGNVSHDARELAQGNNISLIEGTSLIDELEREALL